MKRAVHETTDKHRERTRVYAPQLLHVVTALMERAKQPRNMRAKVIAALLENQNAADCPSCGRRFSIEAYRCTRTAFFECYTLTCEGCDTDYVVEESHTA